MATISIEEEEFRRLLDERATMRAQIQEFEKQARDDIQQRVTDFHRKYGHPVGIYPHVPSERQVRFRLRLIAEEFWELLRAAGVRLHPDHVGYISHAIENSHLVVDLPEFVDGLGDLQVVVTGGFVTFGVDGRKINTAIHAANMSKVPVMLPAPDGQCEERPDPTSKPTKPEGWAPPNIAAVLRDQGWDGFDGRRTR